MLKKTSAFGGLAIAATAAGLMLTSSPASAQVPMWHHHHGMRVVNRNVNVNKNRIIVRVRIHNRNNNIAVANNNRGFRRDGFRRWDGFWGRDGFFGDGGCCGRGFDGDGFRNRRFHDDDGVTAIVRGGDIFAHAG